MTGAFHFLHDLTCLHFESDMFEDNSSRKQNSPKHVENDKVDI